MFLAQAVRMATDFAPHLWHDSKPTVVGNSAVDNLQFNHYIMPLSPRRGKCSLGMFSYDWELPSFRNDNQPCNSLQGKLPNETKPVRLRL
jgi:hypothetical protein